MADRYSGGVVGVLVFLTLVLQVVLASPAAAALPLRGDICTAMSDGAPGTPVPEHRQECPCSLLCQAGTAVFAALAPTDLGSLPIRFAEAIDRPVMAADPPLPTLRTSHRQARAPPILLEC